MTNKYKFIKHLGKGTSSSVDLVEDENGHALVIKHCNMENKNAWKEECLKEIAITSSLAQTNINCNFPISQMKNIADEDIMISTFIQGKEVSKDILDKLPKHQQTKIAENLGEFLYHLHSQEIIPQHKNSSSYCLDMFNGKEKKIKERLDLLPEEIQKQVKQIMLEIDNDVSCGKISARCHGDLIKDNLLYDETSQKLSVIDFGDVGIKDIYTDFAYLMRAGQLGDKFGVDVINAYNKINQQNNTGIQIKPHTAKKLAILFSLKKIKNLNNNCNLEKLRFINYIKEYKKNKQLGIYRENISFSRTNNGIEK